MTGLLGLCVYLASVAAAYGIGLAIRRAHELPRTASLTQTMMCGCPVLPHPWVVKQNG